MRMQSFSDACHPRSRRGERDPSAQATPSIRTGQPWAATPLALLANQTRRLITCLFRCCVFLRLSVRPVSPQPPWPVSPPSTTPRIPLCLSLPNVCLSISFYAHRLQVRYALPQGVQNCDTLYLQSPTVLTDDRFGSGTGALAVMIHMGTLFTCNVGASRAVLCSAGIAQDLSRVSLSRHRPECLTCRPCPDAPTILGSMAYRTHLYRLQHPTLSPTAHGAHQPNFRRVLIDAGSRAQ